MIISDFGLPQPADQVKARLERCGAEIRHTYTLIPGMAVGLSPDALQKLFRQYPNARIIPDRRRQIPPVPFGPDEWAEVSGPGETTPASMDQPHLSPLALTLMRAVDVHSLGMTGEGVKVCVIDSGVDFGHPDLFGTAVVGSDGQPLAADFTETDLTDTIGHGTAVAGCIASQGKKVYTLTDERSGKPVGRTRIKGVAPGVRIMSAKVFDSRVSSGYDSAIIAALEWAAENGAQIVNMSLGGQSLPNDGTDPLAAAVSSLQRRGIVVTVSAGNAGGGHGTLKSPGSSPGAITVGASTMYRSFAELGFLAEGEKWTSDQLAAFSSLGPAADGRVKPELVAPGAYDWGLAPTSGSEEGQYFELFGGTSQAAPLVAGAVALVFQAFNRAHGRYPTPGEVLHLLCATADDLGLPAHMQGSGRVNAYRAVQAAMGESQDLLTSIPGPGTLAAGAKGELEVEVQNSGRETVAVDLTTRTFEAIPERTYSFHGRITTPVSPQHISFEVQAGIDLMQVSLDWLTEEHSGQSPRLMLALFDPDGRFVNYQSPNSSGDLELGKSVDTWVARPQPGIWRARILLRLGNRDTIQPFTLSVRPHRSVPWSWLEPEEKRLTLQPGEQKKVTVRAAVPAGAAPGSHSGHMLVGPHLVPMAVRVPITLSEGQGTFSGSFQHGYQGSWGNGDWYYHAVMVPEGTRSILASVQWPDVDNALEFYLISPEGHAVLGRSNNADMVDDGDSDVLGGQLVLAEPKSGTWILALHSYAFCGRGVPEPFFGYVKAGGDLVSPRRIELEALPSSRVPLAILVRNPGRLPLTVAATVQTTEQHLIWHPVTTIIKSGVTPTGQAEGEGHVVVGTIKVPFGARQVGVALSWDQKETEVSVSLFDPVAQGDRSTLSSSSGQVTVVESHPVMGEWTVIAGVTNPAVSQQTLNLSGATFVVAPRAVETARSEMVIVQPGEVGVLPVTLEMPADLTELHGRIQVSTTQGDQLGTIPIALRRAEK